MIDWFATYSFFWGFFILVMRNIWYNKKNLILNFNVKIVYFLLQIFINPELQNYDMMKLHLLFIDSFYTMIIKHSFSSNFNFFHILIHTYDRFNCIYIYMQGVDVFIKIRLSLKYIIVTNNFWLTHGFPWRWRQYGNR